MYDTVNTLGIGIMIIYETWNNNYIIKNRSRKIIYPGMHPSSLLNAAMLTVLVQAALASECMCRCNDDSCPSCCAFNTRVRCSRSTPRLQGCRWYGDDNKSLGERIRDAALRGVGVVVVILLFVVCKCRYDQQVTARRTASRQSRRQAQAAPATHAAATLSACVMSEGNVQIVAAEPIHLEMDEARTGSSSQPCALVARLAVVTVEGQPVPF